MREVLARHHRHHHGDDVGGDRAAEVAVGTRQCHLDLSAQIVCLVLTAGRCLSDALVLRGGQCLIPVHYEVPYRYVDCQAGLIDHICPACLGLIADCDRNADCQADLIYPVSQASVDLDPAYAPAGFYPAVVDFFACGPDVDSCPCAPP